jgi:hypothetical protein
MCSIELAGLENFAKKNCAKCFLGGTPMERVVGVDLSEGTGLVGHARVLVVLGHWGGSGEVWEGLWGIGVSLGFYA